MSKKVFVIGGTGAMGRYLIPELLKGGWTVDVLSLMLGKATIQGSAISSEMQKTKKR